MITKSVPRYKSIRSEDPQQFDEQINKAMDELWHLKPEVSTDNTAGIFSAQIRWMETTNIPETVKDEFNLKDMRYLCRQCPLYDDPGDKRLKYAPCKYCEDGKTLLNNECCELFYKLVKQGEIVPDTDPLPMKKQMVVHGTGVKWI